MLGEGLHNRQKNQQCQILRFGPPGLGKVKLQKGGIFDRFHFSVGSPLQGHLAPSEKINHLELKGHHPGDGKKYGHYQNWATGLALRVERNGPFSLKWHFPAPKFRAIPDIWRWVGSTPVGLT